MTYQLDLNDNENIIILLCIGKEDKTRWTGVRCQETKRRILNEEITEVHFYEKRRPGQAKSHGSPVSKIITISSEFSFPVPKETFKSSNKVVA